MRIVLGTTVLAAGGAESPAGLVIAVRQAVQAVDYLRGTYGVQIPRGNKRHEISFTVSRIHRGIRAAEQFVLDHPQSLPTSGMLVMESRHADGLARRWATDAVLVSCDLVQHLGASTVHAYRILCGQLLAQNPAFVGTVSTLGT